MTPLRESYLLSENEQTLNSVFAKVNIYNNQKLHFGNKLNESRFNRRFDRKFNYQEQESIKTLFKLMESKYINSVPLNEGFQDKVAWIKAFFQKFKEMTVKSVKEFVNAIIELFHKLGNKLHEFYDSVFGFDGYGNFQLPETPDNKFQIDSKHQNFLGAVGSWIVEHINNQNQIQEINKELNEDFVDTLSQKVGGFIDQHVKNKTLHWFFTGQRKAPDGTEISFWKTIGITLLGSLVICVILPPILSMVVGPVAGPIIAVILKWMWKGRAVFKVLYNYSRMKNAYQNTPDDKRKWYQLGKYGYIWWSLMQLLLIFGLPALFKYSGLNDKINEWIQLGFEKMGISDQISNFYENIGLVQDDNGHLTINDQNPPPTPDDVQDPQEFQDHILSDHPTEMDPSKLAQQRSLFRAMLRQGKGIDDYIQEVANNQTHLDAESAQNLAKFMKDFDKGTIDHNFSYENTLEHQLHGVKTIQIYWDESDFKNNFNGREGLVPYIAKRLGEEGIPMDNQNVNYYNILNKASWDATHGQGGAVDCLSLNIENTPENQEIVQKILDEVKQQPEFGRENGHIGILNAVEKPEIPEPEPVVEPEVHPTPNFVDGMLYSPYYQPVDDGSEDDKEQGGGGNNGGTTPPQQIPGMVLHDVEKDKDYPIHKILVNVKMTACDDIMPMTDLQKMLKIEQTTLQQRATEIKERLNIKLEDYVWNSLFEDEEVEHSEDASSNQDRQTEENIKKEQNLIAYVSQGKFTITTFISNDDPFNGRPIAIFCPYYCMFAVAKEIAQGRPNIFPFKNLFHHYTVRCQKEKESELKKLLSNIMYDSVLRTYEVIKFTGHKWNLVEEKNRQLYPTSNSPKGEIKMLGFLTVPEFCAVYNNAIEPFRLFMGPMNVNQTIGVTRNKENKKYHLKGSGGKTAPEGQALSMNNITKDSQGYADFDPWNDNQNNNQNQTNHSQSTFSYHDDPNKNPKGGLGGNSEVDNGYGRRTNPQRKISLAPSRQNSSFDFDNHYNQLLNETGGNQMASANVSTIRHKSNELPLEIQIQRSLDLVKRKIEQLKRKTKTLKSTKTKLIYKVQTWLLQISLELIKPDNTKNYNFKLPCLAPHFNNLEVSIDWDDGYDSKPTEGEDIYDPEDPTYRRRLSISSTLTGQWPYDINTGECWDTKLILKHPHFEVSTKNYYKDEARSIVREFFEMSKYNIEYDGAYEDPETVEYFD